MVNKNEKKGRYQLAEWFDPNWLKILELFPLFHPSGLRAPCPISRENLYHYLPSPREKKGYLGEVSFSWCHWLAKYTQPGSFIYRLVCSKLPFWRLWEDSALSIIFCLKRRFQIKHAECVLVDLVLLEFVSVLRRSCLKISPGILSTSVRPGQWEWHQVNETRRQWSTGGWARPPGRAPGRPVVQRRRSGEQGKPRP